MCGDRYHGNFSEIVKPLGSLRCVYSEAEYGPDWKLVVERKKSRWRGSGVGGDEARGEIEECFGCCE